MKELVELADGTIVENAYVVKLVTDAILVFVRGEHTFAEMMGFFGDASKTVSMKSKQYESTYQWDGFTEVTSVVTGIDESYVRLRKPL